MSTYIFAGASSAIAIETAKLLQEKGHSVIALSRQLVNHPYDDFYQVPDYSFGNFPEIDREINGLVYFPGSINLKPFERIKQEEFVADFTINALGAVAFSQFYLKNLKKADYGSMVFISSVAAGTGLPFHSSISLAKGAIEGLTKALAAELAPSIRVNCIAPSLVNTPLANRFVSSPEKLQQMQKMNPLKKIGEALDIASIIEFLLSKESAWISGQSIAIDGGMSSLRV
jgi:3-oxoacyl-[acyl-carrier protein] reductase